MQYFVVLRVGGEQSEPPAINDKNVMMQLNFEMSLTIKDIHIFLIPLVFKGILWTDPIPRLQGDPILTMSFSMVTYLTILKYSYICYHTIVL